MKRLSIVLFASAVLFGFFSQSFATPVPMEVERQPVRRVAIFSGERMDIEQQEILAEDAPTATQAAVPGSVTSSLGVARRVLRAQRVLRTGASTEPGGDFFAGQ